VSNRAAEKLRRWHRYCLMARCISTLVISHSCLRVLRSALAAWCDSLPLRDTLRALCATLPRRWVTQRARWVALRARWVTLRARWVTLRARWLTAAKSLLGDAKGSLGDATSSLGDTKSSLDDAKSSLGDAKSSLGDALGGGSRAQPRRAFLIFHLLRGRRHPHAAVARRADAPQVRPASLALV
jgi:hypothetical protein